MEKTQTVPDADALLLHATAMVDAGRTGAARPLLAALRRLTPPSAALCHLAGRIALKDGAVQEAGIEFDHGLNLEPENTGMRLARAELRQRLGDLDGATRDAAEAVIHDKESHDAKALLGILMLQLGRTDEAIACLNEAIARQPANAAFLRARAMAYNAAGDHDAALETLQAGIATVPTSIELRNDAIMLCIRRRDFAAAGRISDEARKTGVVDATTFGLRGHALSSLGSHAEAAEAYADALKLEPNDPYIRHLVAASGFVPSGTRAPEAYLQKVFDSYADRFDTHLISLGYRVPGLLHRALLDHPLVAKNQQLGPVLDLGCGTGLAALALSNLPIGPFTGVDVSTGMLAQAKAKQLYSELRDADLMAVLSGDSRRWPLILAADVLVYFGALEEVLQLVHARLEPGGWFVFTIEQLLPYHDGTMPANEGWLLQRHGRYSHTLDYITQAATQSGFRIVSSEPEMLRMEADAPVPGALYVLERVRHDG